MLIEYTEKEGGGWLIKHLDCNEEEFINELAKHPLKENIGSIMTEDDKINLCFHSLKFQDGRGWDSYNGWRN